MNLFSRALSSVLVGLVPSYRIGGMVTVIVNPPPPVRSTESVDDERAHFALTCSRRCEPRSTCASDRRRSRNAHAPPCRDFAFTARQRRTDTKVS